MILSVRKAAIADIPLIKNLIDSDYKESLLLPVSQEYIAEHIRDFIIAESPDIPEEIIGCSSLRIYSKNLSEIRSLIVDKRYRKHGVGSSLLDFSLKEALEIGIKKIFALTKAVGFFKKFTFNEIDKSELPEKVYRDCLSCEKFHDCDETAVIKELFK